MDKYSTNRLSLKESDCDFLMLINKVELWVKSGLIQNVDKYKLFPRYAEIIADIKSRQ